MTTLIEDSPRPFQASWIVDAVASGFAAGAVLTPWASPWRNRSGPGMKPGIRDRAADLVRQGVVVWFDPVTHALQMGGVGDFRYYDDYDLWGGQRGALSSSAERDDHIGRVFDLQQTLGSPRLAPTILLHTGLSATSLTALELARQAVEADPNCWLSVAGTSPFWASGQALDAHVGALAGLQPKGWFLSVARPIATMPVGAAQDEVHGLCRTARALAMDAPVHVSHGDLAALPAVAAGACTVGTGWDKRQRVLSYADYAARTGATGGGGWLARPTLRGLMGSLNKREAEVLESRDPVRLARLGGLPAPGPKEGFFRHAEVLSDFVKDLNAQSGFRGRYTRLVDLYLSAIAEWAPAQSVTSADTSAANWIDPFYGGLMDYGKTEGW